MKKKFQKLYETLCPSGTKFTYACLSSPESELYAASDENKGIYIWKRGREQPLISLLNNSSLVTALNLNSEDAELYSGLKGGLVVIWDLGLSKVKYNLQGHSSEITSINMAKCENIPTYLATASLDGKIKWWDIRAKGSALNIKGHLTGVRALSISPDLNYIASGADDGLVRLWDIRANRMMKELSIDDQGPINCVEFNPGSYSLAYGANDKLIKHWDLNTYSLICVTPVDRLPIQKIKFNYEGTHVFSGTNETIKFWDVDEEIPKLEYMAETGWNKLQDMQYVDNDAIYGINTYGNKIGYWMIPYDIIATSKNLISKQQAVYQNINSNVKKAKSDIISDFQCVNDNLISKHINNLQSNIQGFSTPQTNRENSNLPSNSILNKNPKGSVSDFYTTEAFLNQSNQIDNVFAKNGLNIISAMNKDYFNEKMMNNINTKETYKNNIISNNFNIINQHQPEMINKNEIILQKNVVINNINSNIPFNMNQISEFSKFQMNMNMNNVTNPDESINFDTQYNLEHNLPVHKSYSENIKIPSINNSTNFISSEKNTEPMGLDINNFMHVNLDETLHEISQSNDIPIIQEINEQHTSLKGAISKRFNSLKMVLNWWSQSDITATVNALNLMKDNSVINDFFNFGILGREDIYKVPFTLDNGLSLLPHISNLINSKYEPYCLNGIKTGLIFLRILNEKILQIKSENSCIYKEDKSKKIENIVELFYNIFTTGNLEKLCKRIKNLQLSKAAESLYTDLEFFLKPFRK